jgi:micrococcal nuclease
MSKIRHISSRQKSRSASKPARRKIGRDLLAVLFLVAGLGLGLSWMHDGPARALALLTQGSERVLTLAQDLSAQTPTAEDDFPVSSIGKKPAKENTEREVTGGHYPVCSSRVGTRDNCVVDGDTFTLAGATIRISDIDAPETHPPRCAYEADLGDRATRRLSALLSSGRFRLVRDGRDIDRYGRKLRVVIRDGRSVGRMLVAEGLARPWTGKRRPWCDGNSFG